MDHGPDGICTYMTALAAADPDEIFAALMRWIDERDWVTQRLDRLSRFAAADDFAMPPVRIFSGHRLGGLVLAEVPPITLSLMVRQFHLSPLPDNAVIFSPGYGLTRIIKSGGARMRRFRVPLSPEERGGQFRAAAAAPCEALGESALCDGMEIRADQSAESFNLIGGDSDIVMLQIFVRAPTLVPMREYDAGSGRLVRVAAAGRATSFRQMGLSLLRAFGRRDAAAQFVSALDDADFAMRWQVMRELVALDARTALPHLAAMAANDPHPEVRTAAAVTEALVREHLATRRQPATEAICPS